MKTKNVFIITNGIGIFEDVASTREKAEELAQEIQYNLRMSGHRDDRVHIKEVKLK